jgi:ribosome-binding factor A
MQGKRSLRVRELLQQELSYLFTRRMKDPRLESVTITRVEMTDDIKYARVYVSIYGKEEDRDEIMKALEGATGFIRGQLGRKLRIKQVPELTFRLDDSAEYSVKISKMLRDLGVSDSEDATQ